MNNVPNVGLMNWIVTLGPMFLQTKAHLDILAEALLRWARGR